AFSPSCSVIRKLKDIIAIHRYGIELSEEDKLVVRNTTTPRVAFSPSCSVIRKLKDIIAIHRYGIELSEEDKLVV
ncbi:hypothetical protein V5H41_29065, partial [Salmonella enterica]